MKITYSKVFISVFLFIHSMVKVMGQEKKIFVFKGEEVAYYLSSNMNPRLLKLPNNKAKVVIVQNQQDILDATKTNKSPKGKIARKDHVIYYYLQLPNLKDEKQYLKFLKTFTEHTYYSDFYNRNRLSIEFQDSIAPFSCESLDYLNVIFAKIVVLENNNLFVCDMPFVVSENQLKQKLRTTIHYEPITIKESELKREDYKVISQLHNWERHFFTSISIGNHSIENQSKTSFDEETLVDINEVKTIWQITSGYMFNNKIGVLINLGLMSSKEQNTSSDIISINGTGNGFGIVKIGIGARYQLLSRNEWSIYGDLTGGFLNARAAGGSGSVTFIDGGIFNTRNISERTEQSNFLTFSLGANYRLGGLFFLTSNLQYTTSNFKSDIGSISGFTGYTFNLGFGFSFK